MNKLTFVIEYENDTPNMMLEYGVDNERELGRIIKQLEESLPALIDPSTKCKVYAKGIIGNDPFYHEFNQKNKD